MPTQASQAPAYTEGPTNHQQLLQAKADFARLSQTQSTSTISGLGAPSLFESQQDSSLGPAFMSGGKKFVSLKNLAPAIEELKKNNKSKGTKNKKKN